MSRSFKKHPFSRVDLAASKGVAFKKRLSNKKIRRSPIGDEVVYKKTGQTADRLSSIKHAYIKKDEMKSNRDYEQVAVRK